MADKWTEERERQMRERDRRRSEQYGRGGDYGGEDYAAGAGEARSWDQDDNATPGAQRGGPDRDRVFGERETGANYTRGTGVTAGGGAYGAGGTYGGGESYGRSSGAGRPAGYQSGGRQGGGYRGPAPRIAPQDYTGGGRFYGDDEREPIYREEYGQGGVEYGDVPRGYDARSTGGPGGAGGYQERIGPTSDRRASGGTGGYDYERGYGDAGRGPMGRDRERWDERGGDNRGGEGVEFMRKAGERISNWFKGDHLMHGSRPEDRNDYEREHRIMEADRGRRGMGPKNYKRPDERINEEAHERLTDDSWLDATNITITVSGGEITLSGTVENREAKHRAERVVEDISGVNHVQNNLRVDRGGFLTSPSSGYGDSVLESQMRKDDPSANASGGAGGGQSTAGKKT